jgi:hypothetical protein
VKRLPWLRLKAAIAELPEDTAVQDRKDFSVYVIEVLVRGVRVPTLVYVGSTANPIPVRIEQHASDTWASIYVRPGWPFRDKSLEANPGALLEEVTKRIPASHSRSRAELLEAVVSSFLIEHGYVVASDKSPFSHSDIKPLIWKYLK